VIYEVVLTDLCIQMLEKILDRRIQKTIVEAIQDLEIEPQKKGKALVDDLTGYRSVRAVGQRYRIIYSVDNNKVIVTVVGAGIRKDGDKNDIYKLAKKLRQKGLI
jgi:mRNA interferase RelE/StbE